METIASFDSIILGVPVVKVAVLPNTLVYTPLAVDACTGMLVLTIEASPKRTFIVLNSPDVIGASHLLLADKLVMAALAVPVLLLKAVTLNLEAAVVAGFKAIGE